LVLDEADQMLDMGFVNDVKKIKAYKKQTNYFLCNNANCNSGTGEITNQKQ
jgi:superfamily II DNA/RNA helicase